MNSIFYAVLFVLCVFLSSCTQIVLKKSASQQRSGIHVYFNKTVIISNVIFVGITLVAVVLYRYIQLSTATLLNSASYVFVLVLSAIFLKEKISKRKVVGITFILAGVAVYAVLDGVI